MSNNIVIIIIIYLYSYSRYIGKSVITTIYGRNPFHCHTIYTEVLVKIRSLAKKRHINGSRLPKDVREGS